MVMLSIYYQYMGDILLSGGTAPYQVTTRNPISIFILLGLVYLMAIMGKYYMKRKKVIQTMGFSLAAGLFFFMSGQVVVNKLSSVQEQFVIIKIKEHHFDMVTAGLNYGGYDPLYHQKDEYPCYEYCQSIFFRYYQVGPYKQFTVFRGLGPLFSLEENKLWPTN